MVGPASCGSPRQTGAVDWNAWCHRVRFDGDHPRCRSRWRAAMMGRYPATAAYPSLGGPTRSQDRVWVTVRRMCRSFSGPHRRPTPIWPRLSSQDGRCADRRLAMCGAPDLWSGAFAVVFFMGVQAPRRLASHKLGRAVALAVRCALGRQCDLDGGETGVRLLRGVQAPRRMPRICSGARSRLPALLWQDGG